VNFAATRCARIRGSQASLRLFGAAEECVGP
jgi:hypothetical protein